MRLSRVPWRGRGGIALHSRRLPSAVLYQDADFLAIDKSAGETVVPARGDPPEASLAHRLAQERGERVWVVHRLDRDTTGVVVFARNADAHRELNRAFEERRVEKEYVSYVAGRLLPARGRIDLALHGARRGKARPAEPDEPGRQEAVTDYVEERAFRREGQDIVRLRLFPRTGRHHQIRVHLRARGAPILFDPLYGRGAVPGLATAPCARLALHAARVTLPTAAGPLAIEAPLPTDLAALEAWLAAAEPA
jgi:RluA family pseudouridine synthase